MTMKDLSTGPDWIVWVVFVILVAISAILLSGHLSALTISME